MIYAIYSGLAFIALLLFVPAHGSYVPRNLPLLLTLISLYLLYYIIRFFKYIILLSKTASLLKRQGYMIRRVRIFPFASFFRGEYSLLAEKRGELYSFFFLVRKRWHYRYHFDSRERLEFYASNRLMIIGRGRFYSHRTIMVQTRRAGKHRLKWQVPTDKTPTFLLILNKYPDLVTDATQVKQGFGNGDLICDTVRLYDFKGFSEAIKDEKFRKNG